MGITLSGIISSGIFRIDLTDFILSGYGYAAVQIAPSPMASEARRMFSLASAESTTATTVNKGANFTLSNSVKNQGGSAAGSSTVAFHLSTDTTYGNGDDVVITQTRTITSVAIGATSTASTTLTVPLSTPSGTYYVCAMADTNNTVAEGDETNNTRCTATTINIP